MSKSSGLPSEFVKLSKITVRPCIGLGCKEDNLRRVNMVCGYGQTYPMSAFPKFFGKETTVTPEKFSSDENQLETWNAASNPGLEIA